MIIQLLIKSNVYLTIPLEKNGILIWFLNGLHLGNIKFNHLQPWTVSCWYIPSQYHFASWYLYGDYYCDIVKWTKWYFDGKHHMVFLHTVYEKSFTIRSLLWYIRAYIYVSGRFLLSIAYENYVFMYILKYNRMHLKCEWFHVYTEAEIWTV